MYKVFLVEDEIVVREGIKNKFQWEEEGFTIVGDESDGELAFPLILREKPDILITDIKMPFMDGLELSKLVKKELPSMKIIIISGYSDFGYAQQAIDIGVNEYLLKPLTSSKLMTSVKNAAAAIEKERKEKQILEQYELLIYQKQVEKRKNFFNALISEKMSYSQIVAQEEELGISMIASVFCVLLFQFKVQDDLLEYSDDVVQCEQKMVAALKDNPAIRIFERDLDGWALILLGENEPQIDFFIHDISELIRQISAKIYYFGGIGRCVNRLRDLHLSYLDANKAFSMRYFESRSLLLSYKDINSSRSSLGTRMEVSDLNLEKLDKKLLEDFLKRGTQYDVDEFVESYFDGFYNIALQSSLFRHYIVMDGYTVIVKFLGSLQYSKDRLDTYLGGMNAAIEQLNSLEDCCTFYKTILKKAIDLRSQSSLKRYAGLIEQAKDYMNHNFAQCELTLDKVSSTVNISPNYFSSLFNQETGMTFIEYLTNLRMEKAKEFLRCSGKKITEIGFLVGYQDSHYFSYIFKKTQYCTPSEYRMQGKGEC